MWNFVGKRGIDRVSRLWQGGPVSTLTVDLPDTLAARLVAASEEKHLPPAQFVLDALERALPEPQGPAGRTLFDALNEVGAIGCIDSGVHDLATNPRYLEGFGKCPA
jgi:hypothetical protein